MLRVTDDANDTVGRVRFLSDRVVGLVAIMLVVVFQPELRQAMITLGQAKFLRRGPSVRDRVVASVSEAADFLSKSQFGAIIVFERGLGLESLFRNAVPIDATVDARLIEAIFYPNNPLHDLAVVIRGDRIAAAKVQLPLAPPGRVPSQLGSRHRAALGITLDSDCLVPVVSEENGRVRFAENGELSNPTQGNASRRNSPVGSPSARSRRPAGRPRRRVGRRPHDRSIRARGTRSSTTSR